MAIITTEFEPAGIVFPFTDVPGGAVLPYTAAPRARVLFTLNLGVIAAKIATNTGLIDVQFEMPANYAYVCEYAYVSISSTANLTDADHYSNDAVMAWRLGDGQGTRWNEACSKGLLRPLPNEDDSLKVWRPKNLYPLPIYNLLKATPCLNITIVDEDAVNATVAGQCSALASFLQYDIEQVFSLGLNFPVPVQVR